MKKEKNNKNFIEKKKVADHEEYVIKKSPSKTWWGKVLVVLILIGMIGLLVVSVVVSVVNMLK